MIAILAQKHCVGLYQTIIITCTCLTCLKANKLASMITGLFSTKLTRNTYKNKMASGENGLLTEMLKEGGAITCDWITKLFNNCLNTRKIP